MTKKNSRRRLRRLGCVILVIVLIGAIVPILRYIWPVFIYPPLLLSLPTPPGYVPGSLHFGGAELDFRGWDRIYDVDQPYEEVVDFFKTKLVKRGWELTGEKSRIRWNPHLQKDVARYTLVFHGPYILPFDIQIDVRADFEQGEQIGTVLVTIYDRVH
jgi:hypothetical protein